MAVERSLPDLHLTSLRVLGMEPLHDSLLRELATYMPEDGIALVEQAFQLAATAHDGVLRASGEPYIAHPLWVAVRLADLRLDASTVAAGLLHDVVEDTDVTLDLLTEQFGRTVEQLVDGVTKLEVVERRRESDLGQGAGEGEDSERRKKASALRNKRSQLETLQKLLLTINDDPRCVLIKLADRLHNMETVKAISPSRQERMASETREIYAPLAGLLGLFPLKSQLEDLAFAVLQPQEYQWVAGLVGQAGPERAAYAKEVAEILSRELKRWNIQGVVSARAKHLWSIYQKLLRHDNDISQIYDLYAVRAIVDTRENCYVTFGLIHELWHPVDGRFKDYIAKPKENGYQSIHTTVFCEGGKLTEFQIRSYEMHQVAEYGIASHWYYKQSGGASPMPMGKLRWIRQLLQLRQESSSAREFVDAASTELFPDQVFVFTPQGDVKDLPRGSTPVDFAYRIHTEVGHHCIGARVNGRLVPLSYILQNADVVEILTARGDHGPSQGWLDFVATSTARQRIQQWLRRRDRPENLARGKEVFERELRRVLRGPQDTLPVDILRDVAREFFHEDIDDFYVAIGCGEISVQAAANRVELRLRQQQPTAASSPASLGSAQGAAAPTQGGTGTDRRLDAVTDAGENYKIRVQGASGLVVRRALCCTPRPPDRIVAYLTRASGATVHRIDCTNVLQEDEPERLVPAEWERPVDNRQVVEAEVQITAKDRPGLLSDISGMVSDVQGNISQCSVRTDRYWAEFHVVFSVPRRDVLDQLLSRISRMDEVERVVNVG